MCGIIGIIGHEPVTPLLVDALKRLEYRGYNSAGVATLEQGVLTRRRAEGKLRNLEQKLAREPLDGAIGIGHTRWATHGRPNETNAHPHATERLAVVHNGIIENFSELRRELEAKGAKFATETDSEVIAHLVTDEIKRGRSPVEAVDASLPRLRGAFALAFLFAGEEDLLIGARKGSPLAIGFGDDAMYIGSDAIALAPFTDTVSYLEDGDCAVIHRGSAEIHDADGRVVRRDVLKSQASVMLIDKGNHRHFMAKEIHEQPEVVGHTLAHYLDMVAERVALPMELPFDFRALERISIAACGAFYAGMVARYSSSSLRICRSTLISPPSSATARCRSIRARCRFSFRSRARPPTRWRRCVTPASTASMFSPSSMCRHRPSPGRRHRRADPGRAGNRRRLDQGVHL